MGHIIKKISRVVVIKDQSALLQHFFILLGIFFPNIDMEHFCVISELLTLYRSIQEWIQHTVQVLIQESLEVFLIVISGSLDTCK